MCWQLFSQHRVNDYRMSTMLRRGADGDGDSDAAVSWCKVSLGNANKQISIIITSY